MLDTSLPRRSSRARELLGTAALSGTPVDRHALTGQVASHARRNTPLCPCPAPANTTHVAAVLARVDPMTGGRRDPSEPRTRSLSLVSDDDGPQVPAGLVLVASAEPGVVFSSLAARCVPEMCDECTVDVIEGPHVRYRLESPPRQSLTGGLQRLAERAGGASAHQVRIPFAHPDPESAAQHDVPGDPGPDEFRGAATFTWHHRTPSRAERTMAAVFVDHALHTISWQRTTAAAAAQITHLRIALHTNRDIGAAVGILMGRHKVTQDRAMQMLRQASQRANRKVHDLALDVLETGRLDPALADDPPGAT